MTNELSVIPEMPSAVRPGDLITAKHFNDLVDFLAYLEERMTALEGKDETVAITGIIPSGPYRVEDVIEIIGRNFDFELGAHRVYFNASRARIFDNDNSGDTRLIVTIPSVPGVSEVGTQVTLTVGNLISTDTTEVTLKPKVIEQQGNFSLTFDRAEPEEIVAGERIDFIYSLSSSALLPASIAIAPKISEDDWQDLLEVVDAQGDLLPGRTIELEPGKDTTFSIRLDPIPPGSDGTVFTLTVTATASGLPTRVEEQGPFEVGGVVEPSDPTVINFDLDEAQPPSAIVGNTITLSPGETARVRLLGEFTGPPPGGEHTYTFSAEVEPIDAGWSPTVPSSFLPWTFPNPFTITGPDSQGVSFDIDLSAGGSSPARLVCKLEREHLGDILETAKAFNLQVA